MNKKEKIKLYELGARLSVFLHALTVITYFIAIPLMFVKGVIGLLAAIYITLTWIQYRILGLCFLTIWENYFLRKAGKKQHRHFISRYLHKLVRGGRKDSSKFKQTIDKLSWDAKTIFFVISLIVIIFYFL